MLDQNAYTEENFLPRLLSDFEEGKLTDVLTAIGKDTATLAEAALYILEERNLQEAKNFLTFIKKHSA